MVEKALFCIRAGVLTWQGAKDKAKHFPGATPVFRFYFDQHFQFANFSTSGEI
jgi:hypothetical protein